MVIIRLFLYAIWICCAPIAIISALLSYSVGLFTGYQFIGADILVKYFGFSKNNIEASDKDYDAFCSLSLLEMIYCIR